MRTNNKLDQHITPSPEIEPRLQFWEASAHHYSLLLFIPLCIEEGLVLFLPDVLVITSLIIEV